MLVYGVHTCKKRPGVDAPYSSAADSLLREATTTSRPSFRRASTTRRPVLPVPPSTSTASVQPRPLGVFFFLDTGELGFGLWFGFHVMRSISMCHAIDVGVSNLYRRIIHTMYIYRSNKKAVGRTAFAGWIWGRGWCCFLFGSVHWSRHSSVLPALAL